jgi:hypothetical protein
MDKPKSVVVALNLLWVSFLIGLIDALVIGIPIYTQLRGPVYQTIIFLISAAVMALFYVKVSAGRNWARIVLAVLLGLALLVILPDLPGLVQNPIRGVFMVVESGLQISGTLLLFTKSASAWFQKPAIEGAKPENQSQ